MAHMLIADGRSWYEPFGFVCALFGLSNAIGAGRALWTFVLDVDMVALFRLMYYGNFACLFAALAGLYLGSPRLLWPKLYAAALPSLGFIFVGTAVGCLIVPDSYDAIARDGLPILPEMPYPFFVIALVFFTMLVSLLFVNNVFFVPLPTWVWRTYVALFVLVSLARALWSQAKVGTLLWTVILVALMMDAQYGWLKKVLKW